MSATADSRLPADLAARLGTAPAGTLHLVVHGKPAGQGSKRTLIHKHTGRPVTMEAGRERLVPWREAVKQAALRAGYQPLEGGYQPMTGPVAVYAVLTFHKPASAPKRRRTWPITRATFDADKLARGLLDALTDAGLWRDDAQVVDLHVRKVFAGEDPEALDAPGARITIGPAGGSG